MRDRRNFLNYVDNFVDYVDKQNQMLKQVIDHRTVNWK